MKRRIKTTYISGPVSGLDRKEAERRFRTAERMIKERGEIPINPLSLCDEDLAYEECMREDLHAQRI